MKRVGLGETHTLRPNLFRSGLSFLEKLMRFWVYIWLEDFPPIEYRLTSFHLADMQLFIWPNALLRISGD